MKWLADTYLRLRGWRFLGQIPDLPKMVIVGAPHTSNWDFILFLAALRQYDLRVSFIGKHSLFRWPLGFWFRRWGGIPVDRAAPAGLVEQVGAAFNEAERMILVMAPEGTRKPAQYWKSGFIWIAEKADVPVVLAGVDGSNRTVEIGPAVTYEGDLSVFMDRLRDYFESKDGLKPEGKGPVRIKEETGQS